MRLSPPSCNSLDWFMRLVTTFWSLLVRWNGRTFLVDKLMKSVVLFGFIRLVLQYVFIIAHTFVRPPPPLYHARIDTKNKVHEKATRLPQQRLGLVVLLRGLEQLRQNSTKPHPVFLHQPGHLRLDVGREVSKEQVRRCPLGEVNSPRPLVHLVTTAVQFVELAQVDLETENTSRRIGGGGGEEGSLPVTLTGTSRCRSPRGAAFKCVMCYARASTRPGTPTPPCRAKLQKTRSIHNKVQQRGAALSYSSDKQRKMQFNKKSRGST